ncbi:methylated-DNA--[protein]-cysteine S-methyltransferase [Listeria booriae]|uniref:Methylated-DNA--protein-cysteine methyltransferase n=1 Tax=Listeria booriae TaxID=1552123 RepID=A0A7X0ZNN6_9LIST|nr:methylated-DNA--[protein]-cysteine S-methyltransferase [Listeria booriae]MBC2282763.1 methylated-DNA--[protein]-cysteine S-methyltransferase [Listeria booriae]MBC2292539.1 methylated-DNA--[protein]-cysteine S-methyltransferase [Listeria booriae]MBC2305048.1 methylated-DNA--[protein]-cysteine S-methyltransferase [Listeria booriae]
MLLYVNEIDSPLGKIYLGVSDDAVNYISYDNADFMEKHEAISDEETPLMRELKAELQQFFKGEIRDFTVPIEVVGTDFQMRVWEALRTIPYGEVVSYKDIAELAGSPKAVRAVGQANHANPIPIIIPCHRVIQADGKIGGYNGSDVERKQWLLALEMPF